MARRPTRHSNPCYEAACHYNLGLGYQRRGERDKAVVHLNHVIDSLPGTVYAHLAQRAMGPRSGKADQDTQEEREER